ncbi:CZB domain-containing protein [Ottowia testudinis]|uniref:CZB domain-containing protein n=1 Tax=Ottowia testudinis TaxID=2816950 RepID=A0A975CMI1_9BURK|nr:CZB domain-containing protein [Ottowia testudinis]QTD46919.1 CZB domain-containing protein [Ottowia testudinis]
MGFFSRLFGLDGSDAAPSTRGPASEMGLDAKAAAAVLNDIDIDTAIAAHENWKLRLQNVLDGKSNEDLKPEVVCMDDRCDLGKWLHGAGRERLGRYPAFTMLVARHKYFHVQASTVVAQAQSGDEESARQTLNGSYRQASNQVILLLKELKRGLTGQ